MRMSTLCQTFLSLAAVSACCQVDVKTAYWTPAYFCSGEPTTFHYRANSCLDKVVINAQVGTAPIAQSNRSSDDLTTNRAVYAQDLPLIVSGKADDQWQSITHNPKIFDDSHLTDEYFFKKPEYWTNEWFGATQVLWKGEHELVFLDQKYVTLYAGGSELVNRYRVTDVVIGFILEVPPEYSARAKAINIYNNVGAILNVTPPLSSISYPRDQGESGSNWSPGFQPVGQWRLDIPPEAQFRTTKGEQYGDLVEAPKPPKYYEQGFFYKPDSLFEHRWVKLRIKCNI